MRTITLIIIHCSAVRPNQKSGVTEIDRRHRARGYKNGCGYHFIVRRDGTVEAGRPIEMIGMHCQNHNTHSIGVCYEGGLDADGRPADTRTALQKRVLRALLNSLHARFPKALILGHNVFNPSESCPCFNVWQEYRDLQPR